MAAVDLCTLADVREFMQVPAGETEQDGIAAVFITAASRAIMRFTKREFAPQRSAVARTFEYDGSGLLDFARFDLRTLTSVEASADEGQTWTALDLTTRAVRKRPVGAPDGVYTRLKLECVSGDLVRVTGAWGWPEVPEDVTTACAMTVAIWLRRDVSTFTTTFSITEDRLERPEAIPSAARGLLADFVRTSA